MNEQGPASMAVSCVEPQHDDLRDVNEHGGEYVVCATCGREWAVHGSDVETITEGDGYCDEKTQ